MRINVMIDDRIMKEALRLSKSKTKKEVIERALAEFIRNRRRLDLRDLLGKIRFDEDCGLHNDSDFTEIARISELKEY